MKLAVYGLGKLGYPLFNVLNHTFPGDVMGVDPAFDGAQPMPNEPGLDLINERAEAFSQYPVAADVSFIVVPTPSLSKGDQRGGFDPAFVETALRQIRNVNKLRGGRLQKPIAVIVSTLSPGTCSELDTRFHTLDIVYNPTFIALGNVVKGLTAPDLLLSGGEDDVAVRTVENIWTAVFNKYGSRKPFFHRGTYTEIELIKLSVNAALGTKISLANSLGQLFEAYGVDPSAVEIVGKDPRIGTAYFKPGSPISGPCLPRDNRALQFAATKVGLNLPLAHATDRVNWMVLDRLYERVMEHKPKTVGIVGMSYKYGSTVTDDAPGPWLEKTLLNREGITCHTYDDLLGGDTRAAHSADVVVLMQKQYNSNYEVKNRAVIKLWS
jgi:UDPglucose 6-dehydrogenase